VTGELHILITLTNVGGGGGQDTLERKVGGPQSDWIQSDCLCLELDSGHPTTANSQHTPSKFALMLFFLGNVFHSLIFRRKLNR